MKSKIDQINDAFIEILTKQNSKQYEEYIRNINRRMIENIDSLTPEKVRGIIRSEKINIDDIALLFMIQNAVMMIVDKKVTKQTKDYVAPIILLLGLYSIKKPKVFVQRISKIVKGVGLNDNEKQAREIILGFERDNKAVLDNARKLAREKLDITIIKSKTSQRMVQDLNKGIAEGKSIEQIKNGLVRKYNKLSNIERALDTELHAQSEYVRQEHSKALGLTHKKWRTQGDSRVRHTAFHESVSNMRVPIDSDFRVAGLQASQPGDTRLPPSDRMRCRCYLEYD